MYVIKPFFKDTGSKYKLLTQAAVRHSKEKVLRVESVATYKFKRRSKLK